MTDYSIDIIKDTSYTIELNEQGPQGIQGERGIQGPEGPIGPKGDKGDVGEKGDTGASVVGVEEISKVGLVTTYRMEFSNGEYFDYQVKDGSIDGLTREVIINIIGYEPASYTSVEGLTTRVSTLEERVEDLTASKANVSLNNLDEVGEKRFTDIQIALDGKQDKGKSGSGLEVCDIGMALYVDETKGLRRYLNGQIVDINTNTQLFLNRLKQITTLHPSLLCTEEEWQTAKTMSAFGQVGKFVFNYSGDDIVSVRIPRVVNVQGLFDLQNLGMTVEAGLPTHKHTRGTMNITGKWVNYSGFKEGAFPEGAVYSESTVATGSMPGGGDPKQRLAFDASRSWTGSTSVPDNSIYGNSNTVQQEAIQYPYFIQIATGQETENNIINEIELNNPFSLLDYKYSEYELNNISWLRSNGQYNSKAVYPAVYDLLLKIYNGTETKAGVSVKLTTETFTDTDFVLNTADETFRLPTKVKLASGKVITTNSTTSQLNNITDWTVTTRKTSTGQWRDTSLTSGIEPSVDGAFTLELSDSDLYLYFYVGETVQNANLIDAGRIGEILPTKTDMQQAAKASMPSDRYIDLSLGASGSTYTAPANGWFYVVKTSSASNQYLNIYNTTSSWICMGNNTSASGQQLRVYVPVKKGDAAYVSYNMGGKNDKYDLFRFIYAEGDK